ncbi:MAG: phosphotransferase [Rhodobacterales bacterium]
MRINKLAPADLSKRVEAFFGARVLKISAPGGKHRGSYRVYFAEKSIIVTTRKSIAQTNYEAVILKQLYKFTDASPEFLGQDNELMFQSDVGAKRLGQHIYERDEAGQQHLAGDAVTALFDIHRAARKTTLAAHLHPMGNTTDWVRSFVGAIDRLAKQLKTDPIQYDLDALCDFIGTPAVQFIKWDCRAGNAAIDPCGQVKWFDFEFAGLRHGAEDFAWLIADETWPVNGETMIDIIADRYPDQDRSWQSYKAYLEVYTCLHAVQRLLLIIDSARKRGWISEARALRTDDVGINPKLGMRLCASMIPLAARNTLTRPMVKLFDATKRAFEDTISKAD